MTKLNEVGFVIVVSVGNKSSYFIIDQANGINFGRESESAKKVRVMKEGTLVVQQILLNYFQELAISHGMATYARRYNIERYVDVVRRVLHALILFFIFGLLV